MLEPIAVDAELRAGESTGNRQSTDERCIEPERSTAIVDRVRAFEIFTIDLDRGGIEKNRHIASLGSFDLDDSWRVIRLACNVASPRNESHGTSSACRAIHPSFATGDGLLTQQFPAWLPLLATILVMQSVVPARQRRDQRPQILDVGGSPIALLAMQKEPQQLEQTQVVRRSLQKRESAVLGEHLAGEVELDFSAVWEHPFHYAPVE